MIFVFHTQGLTCRWDIISHGFCVRNKTWQEVCDHHQIVPFLLSRLFLIGLSALNSNAVLIKWKEPSFGVGSWHVQSINWCGGNATSFFVLDNPGLRVCLFAELFLFGVTVRDLNFVTNTWNLVVFSLILTWLMWYHLHEDLPLLNCCAVLVNRTELFFGFGRLSCSTLP